MDTGVPFIDAISRGAIAVLFTGFLFEIGVQWFRAATRHASDEDAG